MLLDVPIDAERTKKLNSFVFQETTLKGTFGRLLYAVKGRSLVNTRGYVALILSLVCIYFYFVTLGNTEDDLVTLSNVEARQKQILNELTVLNQ